MAIRWYDGSPVGRRAERLEVLDLHLQAFIIMKVRKCRRPKKNNMLGHIER